MNPITVQPKPEKMFRPFCVRLFSHRDRAPPCTWTCAAPPAPACGPRGVALTERSLSYGSALLIRMTFKRHGWQVPNSAVSRNGYGSKLNHQGDRRFWSMFPRTMIPFGVPILDPQPYVGLSRFWSWSLRGTQKHNRFAVPGVQP